MKKNEKETEKNSKPKVTSLGKIIEMIQQPVLVRFNLDGQMCELKVVRALPAVMEKRRALLRAPQPPYVKEWGRYDDLNQQYLQRRDDAIIQARSLTVYLCCPEVAALKPGLTDPAQIHAQISALLTDTILEMIELTALAGGMDMDVEDRANFTSDAPSAS